MKNLFFVWVSNKKAFKKYSVLQTVENGNNTYDLISYIIVPNPNCSISPKCVSVDSVASAVGVTSFVVDIWDNEKLLNSP